MDDTQLDELLRELDLVDPADAPDLANRAAEVLSAALDDPAEEEH